MAYVSSGLRKIADLGFGSTQGASLWVYSSSDPHGTVEGVSYFQNAGYGSASTGCVGMLPGDLVICRNISSAGTSSVTVHAVSSLTTSTGWHSSIHATISAASS